MAPIWLGLGREKGGGRAGNQDEEEEDEEEEEEGCHLNDESQ